uniref:Uncharacterized protein n=1 Tax=Rhizophora mucronata TaxID=61149 RepID=A0A2P2N5Y9_RHIMU
MNIKSVLLSVLNCQQPSILRSNQALFSPILYLDE